jgi:type II secretion system protein D
MPRGVAPSAQESPTAVDRAEVEQSYVFRNSDWRSLHGAMEQILGRPVPVTVERAGQGTEVLRLLVGSTAADEVVCEVRPTEGEVRLRGPPAAVRSWWLVARALDRPASNPAERMEFLPVRTSQPAALKQVLSAVSGGPSAQRPGAGAAGEEGGGDPGAGDSGEGGAIGPVDIQMLEGSDVLILRGHERDVARVRELIRQIEQLSAETVPAVVVHTLRHVNSQALAVLLNEVYGQVFAVRQGVASITALVHPNALLLIGKKENIQTIIELVERLDQPFDAAARFRVYRLRHASALEARTTVEEFLSSQADEEQPGLQVRGRVTADFRTNALIVQASPRDLKEIASLLARLDVGTSEAVNEVRIFRLVNAVAEELAETLRLSIQAEPRLGAATAGTAGLPGQAAAPQVGGPAGAARPRTTDGQTTGAVVPRSTALHFLGIDGRTQQRVPSGILTDVRITADARANALIISAPAESMPLLAAIIHAMDALPSQEAQIKVFTIVNGDARGLVDMLERLFADQGQAAAGEGIPGGDSLVPLRFSVDERTNSIIATGSANDLAVVEAILLRLDESSVRQRETIVYRLKNSPAEAVAGAVNDYLETEREVREIAPETVSPFEQIEREVVVVPEVVSNSLIVSATPRYFEEIRNLVEQLDERPPMVMIQVLIAEVALRGTDEFGVELGLQDSLLFDRSLLGNLETTTNTLQQSTADGVITVTEEIIQAATLTPGFNFNNQPLGNSGSDRALSRSSRVGGQGLSHFAVGRINGELGYGGLVLSASSESVNVLVRALQESRRLEILSRPQIMTLDNQAAYISVGQQVPVVTQSNLNQIAQTNTVEYRAVGLILGVTPRISPDGLVVMEINAERSDVAPEEEGIPISFSATGDVLRAPRINQTRAETTVSALSGQTVVLGGLITREKVDIHRRVPYLSQIPLLGHLFRYDLQATERTELLIIMTPRVVRSEQDAEQIKLEEAGRMNWCLSDVIQIYGDAGLRGRRDAWGDGETISVYPDGAYPDAVETEGVYPDGGQPAGDYPQDSTYETHEGGTGAAPAEVLPPKSLQEQNLRPTEDAGASAVPAGGGLFRSLLPRGLARANPAGVQRASVAGTDTGFLVRSSPGSSDVRLAAHGSDDAAENSGTTIPVRLPPVGTASSR